MTFQEKIERFRTKHNVGAWDFLALISVTVVWYSTYYHDKASLIFSSFCAGYLSVGIGIIVFKTWQRPPQQGWCCLLMCGITLLSVFHPT